MAEAHAHPDPDAPEPPAVIEVTEQISIGERAWPVFNMAKITGFVGMIGAVFLGYFADPGFRRFYFSYLVSFAFFLSIALGALAFVLLQHLTRAGWSVTVRRSAECLAATMPIVFALSAPIVVSVLLNRGDLYRWAQPVPQHMKHADHHEAVEEGAKEKGVPPLDELTLAKRPMLNPWSFTLRIILYFAIWSWLAFFYWRHSTQQDRDGELAHTTKMQAFSAPGLIILALTLTFAAFDLLMSLDPHWFSTMFGIYYLSGSLLAAFASLILVLAMLQRLGYLRESITNEHYHDLGKWLFAFVFFWGYIAFSQYMLLWYANIPEETEWLVRRGGGGSRDSFNGWTWVSLVLLFGQLLIPFAGLMSKHVKRRKSILMFWAAWVLVFHWVDMYWLVIPELDGRVHFGLVEIFCFLGIGGIFFATFLRLLSKNALRTVNDPRMAEALIFQQV